MTIPDPTHASRPTRPTDLNRSERALLNALTDAVNERRQGPATTAAPVQTPSRRRYNPRRLSLAAAATVALAAGGLTLSAGASPSFALTQVDRDRFVLLLDQGFSDPEALEQALTAAGFKVDVHGEAVRACNVGKVLTLLTGSLPASEADPKVATFTVRSSGPGKSLNTSTITLERGEKPFMLWLGVPATPGQTPEPQDNC